MVLKCRSCLIKVESQDSVNIFTTTKAGQLISDFLLSLAPIQILNNDGFPTNLCRSCEEKVNVLVDFRTLLMTSDAVLRKMKNTSVTNKDQTLIKDEILEDYLHTEEILEEKYHRNQSPDFCFDSPTWQENKQSKSENIEIVDSRVCCPSPITQQGLLQNLVCVKEELMNEDFLLEDTTTDQLEEGPSCSEQMEETASFSNDSEVPSDIEDSANAAINSLIPEKSRTRYAIAYKKFEGWCELKKVKTINERVLLAYFESLKTLKTSTLWTNFSMLRAELTVRKNIDIKRYTMLTALLKRRSTGYHPKKSMIFTKESVENFIKEAEDKTFLFAKVAMVIGIAGACKRAELTYLRESDVSDEGTFFKIIIPEPKTNVIREFVVSPGNISGVNCVDLIRKYKNMRPHITRHDRFFVKYYNGKCGPQPVGINAFGKLPTTIAQYLGLPNPRAYTGHSFRRSSAFFLADPGADIVKVKQHGGWKSSSVPEPYVGSSPENKKENLGETSDA